MDYSSQALPPPSVADKSRDGGGIEVAMADDTAITGQYGNLQAVAAAGRRIGIDVLHFEAIEQLCESGDELVAERAAFARIDDEPGFQISCGLRPSRVAASAPSKGGARSR